MTTRPIRAHTAWAIEADFDWGSTLLGHGWFGWGVPEHADGCRTALFKTRERARGHLPRIRASLPARVVKVEVAVLRPPPPTNPSDG